MGFLTKILLFTVCTISQPVFRYLSSSFSLTSLFLYFPGSSCFLRRPLAYDKWLSISRNMCHHNHEYLLILKKFFLSDSSDGMSALYALQAGWRRAEGVRMRF